MKFQINSLIKTFSSSQHRNITEKTASKFEEDISFIRGNFIIKWQLRGENYQHTRLTNPTSIQHIEIYYSNLAAFFRDSAWLLQGFLC